MCSLACALPNSSGFGWDSEPWEQLVFATGPPVAFKYLRTSFPHVGPTYHPPKGGNTKSHPVTASSSGSGILGLFHPLPEVQMWSCWSSGPESEK